MLDPLLQGEVLLDYLPFEQQLLVPVEPLEIFVTQAETQLHADIIAKR
jgi:hypothetical protein